METGGFSFFREDDRKLAEAEQKKIDYLEERIDYTRPESILNVYDKAIQEQIFQTPVGLLYLKKLQDFLLKQPQIPKERIAPIPVYGGERKAGAQGSVEKRPLNQMKAAKRKEETAVRLQISAVLNVLLLLAICAMFFISLNSDQPNIFNYEQALQDRYAQWEQELTQREQAVRERERELDMESPQNTESSQNAR